MMRSLLRAVRADITVGATVTLLWGLRCGVVASHLVIARGHVVRVATCADAPTCRRSVA